MISFSRGSSCLRDQSQVIAGGFFTTEPLGSHLETNIFLLLLFQVD